jgi:formate dehydrogenase major subunit
MKGNISRRDFLKISGGTTGLLATTGLLRGPFLPIQGKIEREGVKWGFSTATICPYDASGCGFICQTDIAGNLINLEGDPDISATQRQ